MTYHLGLQWCTAVCECHRLHHRRGVAEKRRKASNKAYAMRRIDTSCHPMWPCRTPRKQHRDPVYSQTLLKCVRLHAASVAVPEGAFLTYMAGQYGTEGPQQHFNDTRGDCVNYIGLKTGNHYAITDWNPDTAPHQVGSSPF